MSRGKAVEKNKIDAMEKERDDLEGELNLLNERVKELLEDVDATDDDIKNRLEQIDRKSEELMSQNEKIKALDDEKEQLEKKLSGEVPINTDQQLNQLMKELEEANQSNARPKNSSEAVMGDLVAMAKLMGRMQNRAEAMKTSNDAMIDEEAMMIDHGGKDRIDIVLNEVRVWYGHTSCLFKISESHTFKLLLDEVLTYWSLEPSKNVLVNESNFVWPLNASVREVLAGDSGETKIKVWNREAEAEAKFNWVSDDTNIAEVKQAEEVAQSHEKMILGLVDSEEKEAQQIFDSFMSASKDGMVPEEENSDHVAGMDVTRSVDTQLLIPEESIKPHSSQIDVMRYIRMLVFMAYIVLASQTLFMRRDVNKAHLLHHALSDVFFATVPVPLPSGQTTVMIGGHYVGDQGQRVAQEKRTILEFDKISSYDEFWSWVEGPYRAGVLGFMNGSAPTPNTSPGGTSLGNRSFNASRINLKSTVLRHNLVAGRVRFRQVRSTSRGCVKADILDVFQADCISEYIKGENEDRGIQTTDACIKLGYSEYECMVTIDDDPLILYKVVDVPRNGIYTLSGGNAVVLDVPRYRISNTSWDQMRYASTSSRFELYKRTDGFTYNSELQKRFDTRTYYSAALSYFSDYTGGGYTADIPLYQEEFDSQIGTLKRYMWLDSKTRAVEVTTNLYNPSTDFLTVVQALFEFPASGGIKATRSIKVVRVVDDWRPGDRSRSTMEVGLIVLILFIGLDLAYQWFLELSMPVDEWDLRVRDLYDTEARRKKDRRDRRKMKTQKETIEGVTDSIPTRLKNAFLVLMTPWRIVDLLIIAMFIAQQLIRLGYLSSNNNRLTAEVFEGSAFTDFSQAIVQFKLSINIDCILIFLSTMKTFRYFKYNPNISMVWIVFQRAAVAFFHSFYIFFIYVSMFTFAGYVMFGISDENFLAYDVAYYQVLSMLSGSFNYETMAVSNPFLAPLYYVSVCTFGYLLLKNVFIAIVNDEYYRIAADVRLNGFYWIRSEADFQRDERRKKAEEIKKFGERAQQNFGQGDTVVLSDNRVK
jgi:hypothetical protein|eukprot:Stramenopile-MAST_4_protein_3978